MRKSLLAAAGAVALVLSLGSASSAGGHGRVSTPTLTGWASLPAATFVPGREPSGRLVTGSTNGFAVSFADQPVPGSGIVDNGDGTYDVLSDNGYGTRANSADFPLRIHRLAPVFGRHTVDVVGGITLTDRTRRSRGR
jgi:hypothetical protein